jgi:hypothetical protein
LEDFVYKHIKEESFWDLFAEGASNKIKEDLLFVVSFLDPARLPRTRDLVRRELAAVAMGRPTTAAWRASLLQVASHWGLLTEVFGPVWEVMSLAIRDLGSRTSNVFKEGPAGVEAALQVLDDTMQNSMTRRALINSSRSPMTQVLLAVEKAFCDCWSKGLEILRQPQCGVLSVLGPAPAPALWPKLMGLTLRMATHLEFKKIKGEKNLCFDDVDAGSVKTFITNISAALCGEPAMLALQAAEGRVQEMHGVAHEQSERPEKRPRKEQPGAFPSDIQAILTIIQRLLETVNYVSFLGDSAWPPASLSQNLEDVLWRWSVAADVLAPKVEIPSWKEEAWCCLSRTLRQTICIQRPVYECLVLVQKLLNRVDDDEPEDEHIKASLALLFSRFHDAPQFKTFLNNMKRPGKRLKELVGNSEAAPDAEMQGDEPSPLKEVSPEDSWICHPRVAQVLEALMPSYRGLSEAPTKADPAAATVGSVPNAAPSTPKQSQDGMGELEQEIAKEIRRGPLGDRTNVQEEDDMLEQKSDPVKTPKNFRIVTGSGEGEDDDAEMAMASVGLSLKPTPQSGRRLSSKTRIYVDPA